MIFKEVVRLTYVRTSIDFHVTQIKEESTFSKTRRWCLPLDTFAISETSSAPCQFQLLWQEQELIANLWYLFKNLSHKIRTSFMDAPFCNSLNWFRLECISGLIDLSVLHKIPINNFPYSSYLLIVKKLLFC